MADDYSEYASDYTDVGASAQITSTTTPNSTENGQTFEDVYRGAYLYYANILSARRDRDHEFVENPDLIEMKGTDCEDFLYRIGQPNVTSTYPEFLNDSYTCNELYDIICEYGVDTKAKTSQLNGLLSALHILSQLSSAFLSKENRNPDPSAMTKVLLGEVHGEGKSSIKTVFSTPAFQPAADAAFFKANPGTFFTAECTIELVNQQSKQWCKDILTHTTNILSIGARQFLGNTFTIAFEDPSPTLLTIKFLGNNVDPVIHDNVTLFLSELTNNILPLGFTTEWKWAVSFEEIFTVPLSELLQTQVSLSLPGIGIKHEYIDLVKTLPIPFEKFGVANFDELLSKIPGSDDIVNKHNFATTLDLREFVNQILSTFLGQFTQSGNIKTSCLLDLFTTFAPLVFTIITPFLSNDLTLLDVLSALKSISALGRLVFARDFNNLNTFHAKIISGHSLSFDSKNVFQIDAFFKCLDLLFQKLEEQIKAASEKAVSKV